jgi:hypothetical protein
MKTGRPPLEPRERKSSLVAARFSADERQKIESAAKKNGVKLSEWMRDTLLKTASAA